MVGKHIKGDGWEYLTIPPKGTTAFNRAKGM
jgi:hypothetical protein